MKRRTPPIPLPRLRERGSGEVDSADHTLYTSGDELWGFLKKAGIQQEWEDIFEKAILETKKKKMATVAN